MTTFRFSLAIMIALTVAGCSKKISDEDLICSPSPGLIAGIGSTSQEQLKIADACIHKWGYRLGRAPGSNSEIAKAVLAHCRESIDFSFTLLWREGNAKKQIFSDADKRSFVDYFENTALQRVVEGRAGKCSIRGEGQK